MFGDTNNFRALLLDIEQDSSKFFERFRYHNFVVRLAAADGLEIKVHQMFRQLFLQPWQGCNKSTRALECHIFENRQK